MTTGESEKWLRERVKHDTSQPPAVVAAVRKATAEAGYVSEDWLSLTEWSGSFRCRRGGAKLDVAVTWNVVHQSWLVAILPARSRFRRRRLDIGQAVGELRESIESRLMTRPDCDALEWFTEDEWAEVETLRRGDRVEWIADPVHEDATSPSVRPGDIGEIEEVGRVGVVRRQVDLLGGPEPRNITVRFDGAVTVPCRQSDIRRV